MSAGIQPITFTRADQIRCAKVKHYQLRAKMRDPVWNDFWWTMFAWAQENRRRAAALSRTQVQLGLFL